MNLSDKPLNPFEPTRIDPLESRSIVWENQDASVFNCQISGAALCMGVLTFTGVALMRDGFQVVLQPTLTTLIGVFAAVSAIAMSFIIPAIVSHLSASRLSTSESTDENVTKLFSVYQVQLILGCAFLEGAAFLNVFLYQTSHTIFSLASAAICVALMLVRIPTKSKIQAWIARKLPE
jgi:hypothetical protein